MKNVLITGSSTGVGKQAAILFAKQGYKVYASMRKPQNALEFQEQIQKEKLNIELLQLDVTDISSIKACVNHIITQDSKIDILVNNAGAGFGKTTEYATEEEIRMVTDINYHGVVFCTQAVIPYMREQKAGHIISISSVGGLVGQPFNELYCGAKFAVEGFMESMASYLTEAFNIHFSILEPGGISTEFMKSAIAKTVTDGQLAQGDYIPIFQRYMAGSQRRGSESTEAVYQSADEVAQQIIDLAASEKPVIRKRTSAWAEELCNLKTQADPDGLKLQKKVRDMFL